MKFLRISPFKPKPVGHGGEKRSYQIDYFFNELVGGTCVSENHSFYKQPILPRKTFSYLKMFLKGWKLSRSFKTFYHFRPKNYVALYLAQIHYDTILKSKKSDVVVWEMGCGFKGSWDYIIPFVNQGQQKIIAVVHNLDSLIAGRYFIETDIKSPNWLHLELEALKACDLIITISWEEYWLLKLHGIQAVYYPYYPVKALVEVSERVKYLREKNQQKDFLILGTAVNSPTYYATLELLESLQDEDLNIYIAGYGTDKLQDKVHGSARMHILGALSQEALELKLSQIKAVIIYSLPTTGALTKIPELLACGVPVFVNAFGARSYTHLSGLTIYSNFKHLKTLLREVEIPKTVAYEYPTQEQINTATGLVKSILN